MTFHLQNNLELSRIIHFSHKHVSYNSISVAEGLMTFYKPLL